MPTLDSARFQVNATQGRSRTVQSLPGLDTGKDIQARVTIDVERTIVRADCYSQHVQVVGYVVIFRRVQMTPSSAAIQRPVDRTKGLAVTADSVIQPGTR